MLLDSDFDINVDFTGSVDTCDYFNATIKYKQVISLLSLRVCNDFCEIDINDEWTKMDHNISAVMFKQLVNVYVLHE